MSAKSSSICSNSIITRGNVYRKLLNLKAILKQKNDTLYFILILTQIPWSFKVIRLITFSIGMQISCELIAFFIKLLMTFDFALFLKFGGHVGTHLFVLANVCGIILSANSILGFMVQYWNKVLPPELAGKKSYDRMKLECTLLKIFIVCDLICGTLSGYMHFKNDTYNRTAVFLIRLYSDMLPEDLASLLIFYYKGCFIVCPNISLVGAFILSYVSFHASFQIRIIKRFVQEIGDTYCDEKDQYYNRTNQECIKQRMKICISLHQTIIRDISIFTEMINSGIVLYTIGVLFLGAGLMIDIFDAEKSEITKIVLILAVFIGVLTTGLYAFSGQIMKNEIIRGLYSVSTVVSRSMRFKK